MEWIRRETSLGRQALKAELDRTGNEDLTVVHRWSVTVDETVEYSRESEPVRRPYPNPEAGEADGVGEDNIPGLGCRHVLPVYAFSQIDRGKNVP
ncbi:MAG: hypothetical protein E4H20_01540 [Spirochaetales bacterium]|nr:MAG: hypothetical protein E4H20_01540 [Spirochaetales bacterium]